MLRAVVTQGGMIGYQQSFAEEMLKHDLEERVGVHQEEVWRRPYTEACFFLDLCLGGLEGDWSVQEGASREGRDK